MDLVFFVCVFVIVYVIPKYFLFGNPVTRMLFFFVPLRHEINQHISTGYAARDVQLSILSTAGSTQPCQY